MNDSELWELLQSTMESAKDNAEDWVHRFRSPFFEPVRTLKCHPALRHLGPAEAKQLVGRLLQENLGENYWVEYASGLDPRGEITCAEDGEVEFLRRWDKVIYAAGEDPVTVAMEKAHEHPFQILTPRSTPIYLLFVSTAAWLQRDLGDRNILLPCRALAQRFSCSHMTIWTCIQWAVHDGFLDPREKGNLNGRRASQFRFNLSKVT